MHKGGLYILYINLHSKREAPTYASQRQLALVPTVFLEVGLVWENKVLILVQFTTHLILSLAQAKGD